MLDISSVDPLQSKAAEIDRRARALHQTERVLATSLPFGADRQGRDVMQKAMKGAEVSILVGLAAAVVATVIGTMLGAFAGFFGGIVGDGLEWLYNVFTSIPSILLIFRLPRS